MITRDKILKVTVTGASIDTSWSGLFLVNPTIGQLKAAMHLDIEAKREEFDGDPVGNSFMDRIISDWFALVQIVTHSDTLNAGPVVIAKCEIGKLTYDPVSIFAENVPKRETHR